MPGTVATAAGQDHRATGQRRVIAMARRRSVPGIRSIAWARGSGAAHLPTRSWLLAGRGLAGGAVVTGLVVLAGSVPASAKALPWSVASRHDRGTSRTV